MIQNKLAIDVFEKFIEENNRIPTYKEFIALGYSKSHYYNVKKVYFEQREREAKKVINEVLRKQSIIGKI